jgi:hypothetical protein
VNWLDFAAEAPDLAAAGMRLLTHGGEVPIGFLATVHRSLHLAPVCPIVCPPGLYLSIGAHTPKRSDLDRDGRYVLHAFLGGDDEEFAIAGTAHRCGDDGERSRVHAAIRFGAFSRDDPIYRLDVRRVRWVSWENVGRPGTRPICRTWSARP